MKRAIIFIVLLAGCTYNDRKNWDSGADAENSYQIERQEDIDSGTRNQLSNPGRPSTETNRPF